VPIEAERAIGDDKPAAGWFDAFFEPQIRPAIPVRGRLPLEIALDIGGEVDGFVEQNSASGQHSLDLVG
jgi:hypothetical protein